LGTERENHPHLPDGMAVETHHWVGSHLIEDRIGPSGESGRTYETVIADRTTAQDRLKNEGEIEKFIQETDFDQSYLGVVVAAAWPSGKWLELAEIERTADGLQIVTAVASPDNPVGDDAAVHSMAIRITDEQNDVPESIDTVVR
jgi:hypothetical protein